jgi:hypothetical protein
LINALSLKLQGVFRGKNAIYLIIERIPPFEKRAFHIIELESVIYK